MKRLVNFDVMIHTQGIFQVGNGTGNLFLVINVAPQREVRQYHYFYLSSKTADEEMFQIQLVWALAFICI